jgi:hypothetical protein
MIVLFDLLSQEEHILGNVIDQHEKHQQNVLLKNCGVEMVKYKKIKNNVIQTILIKLIGMEKFVIVHVN